MPDTERLIKVRHGKERTKGPSMNKVMNKVAMVSTQLDNAQLLAALRAFRKGNFAVRLPAGLSGIDGEIAEAFNEAVETSERMTKEFERLGDFVGKDGKIGHRAKLPNA